MSARVVLTLLLCVGCGDDASNQTPAGGSGGGSDTGGADVGGMDAGGAGGSPDPCADFMNETGTDTTIRFRNERATAIYLPRNCKQVDFELVPEAPADPNAPVPDLQGAACVFDCGKPLLAEPEYCMCNERLHRLMPGEELDVVWQGTAAVSMAVQGAGCFPATSTLQACRKTVPAVEQAYSVDIFAYDTCTDCDCFSTGLCSGTGEGAELAPGPTTFSYPSNGVVEVVFSP